MKKKLLFCALLLCAHLAHGRNSINVILDTTEGVVEITLNPKKAPLTVANFVANVESGFYDGTVFHRVIKNFMIQGGGYDEFMMRKTTTESIKNEANNRLRNKRGTIAMARSQDPHSAHTQFFINIKDNPNLNFKQASKFGWGYTVFGKVTQGMEVIDKISNVPTSIHFVEGEPSHQHVPLIPVVIKQAFVLSPEIAAISTLADKKETATNKRVAQ